MAMAGLLTPAQNLKFRALATELKTCADTDRRIDLIDTMRNAMLAELPEKSSTGAIRERAGRQGDQRPSDAQLPSERGGDDSSGNENFAQGARRADAADAAAFGVVRNVGGLFEYVYPQIDGRSRRFSFLRSTVQMHREELSGEAHKVIVFFLVQKFSRRLSRTFSCCLLHWFGPLPL